jgi:hypothetical protein
VSTTKMESMLCRFSGAGILAELMMIAWLSV